MPQLINKTKPEGYVKTERALLRDKRLKPTSKLIYSLLHSLSRSCENVFPTHQWIAEEIGYDNEGKSDDALRKYIKYNLKPLLDLGLIVAIHTEGVGYDYEIHDFYPGENSTPTPEKILPSTPEKILPTLYNGDKREEIEEREEQPPKTFLENSPTQNPNPSQPEIAPVSKKEIEAKLDELVRTLLIENSEHKAYSITQTIRNQIPTQEICRYVDYLVGVEAKRPDFHTRKYKDQLVKFNELAYSKWFYNSFLSWKLEQETAERAKAYNSQIPPKFTDYEETKVEMTEEERTAQLEEIRKNNPKIYKKIMQLRSGEVVKDVKSVAVALPKVPHGTKVEYIDVDKRKNQLIQQLQKI